MNKVVIILAFVFLFEISAFAIDNPIGPATSPQSSYGAGGNTLTPNPRGREINSGNDIVTGNVSGGKEFRGVVPYGSSYYFQGTQENASVQNFLRRSSGSPYGNDRLPQRNPTYISPYQAVTTLQGGRPMNSQVYTPQGPISRTTGVNEYGLVPLEEARKLLAPLKPTPMPGGIEYIAPLQYGRFRPLSVSPEEKELYITKEIEAKLYPTEQKEQARRQMEEFKEQLEVVKENQPLEPVNPVEDQITKPEIPGQEPQPTLRAKVPGVFEEMRELTRKETDKALAEIAAQRAKAQKEEGGQPQQAEPNQGKDWKAQEQIESQPKPSSIFGETPEAKAIIGYSKTFATESRDRFNELMKAAEEYLKSSQFYKAADAYTLAGIYQKENPLPAAGKAHALFAAGEYMSSAYYITRAIEIWPDYLRFKVDLYSLLNKDLVENRIAEITAWQEKTNSPELLMLLGYVYYQTDRLEEAQMSINGAKVKMPDSQALGMLDTVIRAAIAQPKQDVKSN